MSEKMAERPLQYSLDFVAVGCNRQPTSVSWGKNNLIAFAGGRFVGIYDAKVRFLFGNSLAVGCIYVLLRIFQFHSEYVLACLD